MVRSVKEALRVTLHERYPTDETLVTLLAEVENTVNSRPLTHVSVTPSDPEALTPNHILIGPNSHVPNPGVFNKGDMNARHHWRRAQALADEFWRRWVVEYLPLLQHRREPQRYRCSPQGWRHSHHMRPQPTPKYMATGTRCEDLPRER
ncbi:uncharacterized protein LOC131852731 [Achroia grisella]|uniref:uncharacterized protein LOC131852731 n=1 Tax=Achroia grisella TaxID=688607 RepID=UPI0027D2B60D|nr:uncharacterized protein LOC131852731 [Achroia grisella]